MTFKRRVLSALAKDELLEIGGDWLDRWWWPWRARENFFAAVHDKNRILVCTRHAARPIFEFISRQPVPTDSLQMFTTGDDYSFGVLQSNIHWRWTVVQGSKIKEDTRYTSEIWTTLAWPQDPTDEQVAEIAVAGRELRRVRIDLMEQNGWSLRALHQAAEMEGPHPLKEAQAALDAAVADAYGIPPDQDPVAFLLELNQLVAEDEEQGRKLRGPGLPDHLDPKDPRWFSTDCIEPPPVGS